MLRKLACNATNSGAIDDEGNVYVWGAGKYGLLGNPKQKHPISKPLKLQLKSEKLILDYSSDQTFVATSLAFGQYHAAVVVNDIHTNSDFNPLLYGESILNEFKTFLMKCWDTTVKKLPEHQSDVYASEEHIIETTLKFCFKDKQKDFPYIEVSALKELMVHQAKLSFKDTVSYNRMFQDLSDPNDEDKINLKELRDQLIGRRCGNGIVFTWGVVNEGRLGIQLSDKELEAIESKNHDLVPYKPSIVKFDGVFNTPIIVKVSCGNSFTLALSQDGLVYSWGLRNSGGLGQGEQNISMTPNLIKIQKNGHLFQNVKDISCGSNHVLALDHQGIVYSWGNGQGGRLGHGDETGENIPKEISGLRDHKVLIIEAGEGSSSAITVQNELLIWGVGLHGRLGTGKTSNVLKPTFIEDLRDQKVEDVALGSNHSLCILRNGKAMCWGSSKDGKLGLETALDRIFTQPKELVTLDREKLYQISAGPFHTLALTENGEIFSFGNSKDGKLGYEEMKGNVQIPRKITNCPIFARKTGLQDRRDKYQLFNQYDDQMTVISNNQLMGGCEVVQSCCGFSSTLFLLNDGQMYVCGSNKYGQLGFNKFSGGKDKDLNKLLAGMGSSQAINQNDDDNDGDDDNNFGGGNQNDDILPPQLKKKLAELQMLQDVEKPTPLIIYHDAVQMKVRFVSCGYFHVLAVTEEGSTFGWGRNDSGQLGMGRKDNSIARPTRIKSLQDKFIIMTAAGESHSLFLSDLGEVLCAGFNEFGELGIGHTTGGLIDKKDQPNPQGMIGSSQGGGAQASTTAGDDYYDENYQRQLIETKIELTPKVIKGLESIGFIAAGKNHSVAIRTYKRKEKAMRLYTWGCSWHGQTGHGTWQNDYTPKIVKIPVFKDTKFIQATCGSKHTIALDTNGHIWFFGYKPSVGVEDFNEEKQFVPVRLEPPAKLQQEPFKFISSGEEHNLAVTHSGQIYGFGRNMPHTKINSSQKEYLYFEQVESEEKAIVAGCGSNHSVMIDMKGVPYTWGYVGNGRCGLKLEKDDAQQEQESLSAPTVIYFMKTLFQKEINKIKEDNMDKQKMGSNQNNQFQQIKNQAKQIIRFPIQKVLKEQQQSLDEDNLINQDRNILLKFNKLIEEFQKTISEQNSKLLTSFYNAQNALISRIYTFPAKIDFLTDIKAELPKAIIRNKQVFEAIFTLLQTHPCYLINWITKTTVNRQPKEVIVILKIIFGEKEMRNDLRIVHILMMIARKVFQFEMETYDLKEILWGRTDSTFSQLFNLIFESQDQNNTFISHLISSILHKLQKYFLSRTEINSQYNVRITNKGSIQYQFDYESVIQDEKKAGLRIEFLNDFMQICFRKMLKALDPQFKQKSGGNLSNEIISLVFAIKEEINLKRGSDITQEEIDSYILNLVFEILFKKLHELNSDKVKDLYWPLRTKKQEELPDKDVFNFSEKRNLVSVLADHLEKYLRKVKIHYTNASVAKLKEFIADSKQNFRKELSDLLNLQPFNFQYILVKDLFVNSMEFKNSNLCISISDLIFIFNSLVEKGEIIYIQNHEEDPISMLVQELGNTPIEVKQNEKQFISEELLECKLNLEIRHRLLIEHDTFTKCFDCNAPVQSDLLPLKRFKEGVQGKAWVCQNGECREKNDSKQMKCVRCTRYRDVNTLPKDQMFTKYRQLFSDPAVSVFQLLLVYLPVIDVHQNLDDIINYETQVEETRKNSDYDKLEVFEMFKKHKASYMFQNKKKNVNFEDPLEERAAEKEVEAEFLSSLERQLEESYRNKKEHEQRIKEYYQLLKEISDKVSNYLQQHSQMNEEFKLIIGNVYTGLGSEFLKGEKQDIFAGKLHLKQAKRFGKLGAPNVMSGQSLKKQQLSANPQLEQFFGELEHQANQNNAVLQSNYQELQQNKETYKQNFGFFGKYPLYQLRQRKVLNNIQIHGKKLATVMKKCSYVFYDDNDNGFKVELAYEESDKSCLVFGSTTHEAILETFSIDKDIVAEMRRTFATKATIQFGNSEFNVFQLVFLLNEIKSKTYSYQVKPNS